jgi:hypothetical protein
MRGPPALGVGVSGREASIMAARMTTTGMSWKAVAAMRAAARSAPPISTRAEERRSKRRGMLNKHMLRCPPRRKRPSNGG